MAPRKRRVLFVAWFLRPERTWLGEYLNTENYECGYIGLNIKPDITQKRTGALKWLMYFRLAAKARWHMFFNRYDLVVTSFPQVGFAMSFMQWLFRDTTPHIVWLFNMGHAYQGLTQKLSKRFLRSVSRFIVYSNQERTAYSKTLELPIERFVFTPLTISKITRQEYSGTREKNKLPEHFISALGSSSRDYASLFKAIEDLPVHLVVVTHPYAVEGLPMPPNVTLLQSISQYDYLSIIAESDICVIPVSNKDTASGQMTFIQSLALETPCIATRCIGTEDYINDGENALFVEMGDVEGLKKAIQRVSTDEALRQKLITQGLEYAQQYLFDDAGSRLLDKLYTELKSKGELRPDAQQAV